MFSLALFVTALVFPPEGRLGLRGRRHDPSQEEEENLWPDGKRWHHEPGRLREQRAQFVPVTINSVRLFEINKNKSPKYVPAGGAALRGQMGNPSRVAFADVTLWTSQCQGHSSAGFICAVSRPSWGNTAGPDACNAAFSSVNLENRLLITDSNVIPELFLSQLAEDLPIVLKTVKRLRFVLLFSH